jgi:hypothetical protein
MADQKSGSDLDVFEGLSQKTAPNDDAPTPFAPAAGNSGPVPTPLARHKTLLGMPNPPGFPPAVGKLPHGGGTLVGGIGPVNRSSGPPLPGPSTVPPPPPSMRRSGLPGSPSFPAGAGAGAIAPPSSAGTSPLLPGAPASPVTPARPRTSSSDVEMDWDEEDDEKTSVFERNETTTVFDKGSMAADGPPKPLPAPPPLSALVPPTGVRTRPGAGPTTVPPPPGAPMSGGRFPPPPPGLGKPSVARPGSLPAPPRTLAATRIVGHELDRGSVTSVISTPDFRPRKRGKFLIGFVGALMVAGIVFFATQRGGKVSVFVAGPGGNPLSSLTVYIDGVPKCKTSPCNLDLDKGVHAVKASADGYVAQEQGATLHAGEEVAVNFKLEKGSDGTGIKVSGKQDGVELFVDGKEIGPLPQEVKDLSPGPHKILFKGNDRYEPAERVVNVDADQIKDLGPVALNVLRGLASFEVKTPGVKVTLVSGKDRRQLTDFSQPVEIETSKNWTIEATRPGYDDLKQPIAFEDRAEKTFVIALHEHVRPVPEPVAVATPRPAPEPRSASEPRSAPERSAPAADSDEGSRGSATTCTLNFNSIPVSNVVFDGHPLGGTPKLGYSAAPGPHTVIFINADEGKKVTSVICKAGETKTVAVRLSQ